MRNKLCLLIIFGEILPKNVYEKAREGEKERDLVEYSLTFDGMVDMTYEHIRFFILINKINVIHFNSMAAMLDEVLEIRNCVCMEHTVCVCGLNGFSINIIILNIL